MKALAKPAVPVGPASVLGWLASAAVYVSAFLGSSAAIEWKAILASALLAGTNWGRHYQGRKP